MIQINRRSDRSIYKQIYDGFSQLIESSELKAGDLIPSERELCDQLKVSRMTVRAAMDELVRDGLLIRKHGSGTVVSATKITKNALGFMSFSEDMHSRDMIPSSKVLAFTEMVADDLIASQLGIQAQAKIVYCERVRLANDEPMALEKGFLSYDRFPGILQYDLTARSLYNLLENEYDCYPVVAEEIIEAVILNEKEARLLGVTRGSPALLAKRITRDTKGIIIETVQTLYRADRYRMFFIRRRQ